MLDFAPEVGCPMDDAITDPDLVHRLDIELRNDRLRSDGHLSSTRAVFIRKSWRRLAHPVRQSVWVDLVAESRPHMAQLALLARRHRNGSPLTVCADTPHAGDHHVPFALELPLRQHAKLILAQCPLLETHGHSLPVRRVVAHALACYFENPHVCIRFQLEGEHTRLRNVVSDVRFRGHHPASDRRKRIDCGTGSGAAKPGTKRQQSLQRRVSVGNRDAHPFVPEVLLDRRAIHLRAVLPLSDLELHAFPGHGVEDPTLSLRAFHAHRAQRERPVRWRRLLRQDLQLRRRPERRSQPNPNAIGVLVVRHNPICNQSALHRLHGPSMVRPWRLKHQSHRFGLSLPGSQSDPVHPCGQTHAYRCQSPALRKEGAPDLLVRDRSPSELEPALPARIEIHNR